MKLTPAQIKLCKALIRFCKRQNVTIQAEHFFYLGKMKVVKCNNKECHIENPETKLRGIFIKL